MERPDSAPEVNAVPRSDRDSDYESVVVTLGSGAYGAVGPPGVGSCFAVKPTEASQSCERHSAAKGSVTRNCGQRVIWGKSEDGAEVCVKLLSLAQCWD